MAHDTELEGKGKREEGREQTPGAGSEATAAGTVQSPFCREIRSKKYYFLQEMPSETHHLLDGSGHCWCHRTMKAVGPDGEMVRPQDCTAGRSCYKSLFEA